jgi:hypothetical protein
MIHYWDIYIKTQYILHSLLYRCTHWELRKKGIPIIYERIISVRKATFVISLLIDSEAIYDNIFSQVTFILFHTYLDVKSILSISYLFFQTKCRTFFLVLFLTNICIPKDATFSTKILFNFVKCFQAFIRNQNYLRPKPQVETKKADSERMASGQH